MIPAYGATIPECAGYLRQRLSSCSGAPLHKNIAVRKHGMEVSDDQPDSLMSAKFVSLIEDRCREGIFGVIRANMLPPLKDMDVRRAAHQHLLGHARRCPDTLVLDELGLDHGASRIDIAIINGHIRGLEIKAEADTLARLPRQVAAYGRVVDRATLIAADRHLVAAADLLPAWWGIIAVGRAGNGNVQFRRLRAERANPELDAATLVRLLWRTEVVELLRDLGCDKQTLRGPRAVLYPALVAAVPKTRLRSIVRDTLKGRTRWRDHARLSPYDGSCPPTAT